MASPLSRDANASSSDLSDQETLARETSRFRDGIASEAVCIVQRRMPAKVVQLSLLLQVALSLSLLTRVPGPVPAQERTARLVFPSSCSLFSPL
jgi:hypothetical protein